MNSNRLYTTIAIIILIAIGIGCSYAEEDSSESTVRQTISTTAIPFSGNINIPKATLKKWMQVALGDRIVIDEDAVKQAIHQQVTVLRNAAIERGEDVPVVGDIMESIAEIINTEIASTQVIVSEGYDAAVAQGLEEVVVKLKRAAEGLTPSIVIRGRYAYKEGEFNQSTSGLGDIGWSTNDTRLAGVSAVRASESVDISENVSVVVPSLGSGVSVSVPIRFTAIINGAVDWGNTPLNFRTPLLSESQVDTIPGFILNIDSKITTAVGSIATIADGLDSIVHGLDFQGSLNIITGTIAAKEDVPESRPPILDKKGVMKPGSPGDLPHTSKETITPLDQIGVYPRQGDNIAIITSSVEKGQGLLDDSAVIEPYLGFTTDRPLGSLGMDISVAHININSDPAYTDANVELQYLFKVSKDTWTGATMRQIYDNEDLSGDGTAIINLDHPDYRMIYGIEVARSRDDQRTRYMALLVGNGDLSNHPGLTEPGRKRVESEDFYHLILPGKQDTEMPRE